MSSTLPDTSKQNVKLQEGQIVGGKWRVRCNLGSGAFGAVYLVERLGCKSSSRYAAMKVEPRLKDEEDEVLRMDVFVLSQVQQYEKFCTIYDFSQNDKFSYVVMTLIGPKTLDDLRRKEQGRKFSKVSTLKIGIQVISALARLHEAGFIHRDIKPANLSPGRKRSNVIYLFDFGLARFIYEDNRKQKLRSRRNKVFFRGTYRYCSINAHRNGDQGRVDDLWGLLYSLIELCKGHLPWSGRPPRESLQMKEQILETVLFEDCPPSFLEIKRRLERLRFEDVPDYNAYQLLMHRDVLNYGGTLTSKFEWEEKPAGGASGGVRRKQHEEGRGKEAANREGGHGDSDTIRSVTRSMTESISRVATDGDSSNIEDTLDDIPEDLLLKKQKKQQQRERDKTAEKMQRGTAPADENNRAPNYQKRSDEMRKKVSPSPSVEKNRPNYNQRHDYNKRPDEGHHKKVSPSPSDEKNIRAQNYQKRPENDGGEPKKTTAPRAIGMPRAPSLVKQTETTKKTMPGGRKSPPVPVKEDSSGTRVTLPSEELGEPGGGGKKTTNSKKPPEKKLMSSNKKSPDRERR